MVATHEPLRTCVDSAHVRRNMGNKCRVAEFNTCFACEVHSTLVNTCYQCSSCQYACCHRTPEELGVHQLEWFTIYLSSTNLVGADAGCHSQRPESQSHTDTATDIGERFSGSACCGTLLREVDNLLQGSNGIRGRHNHR
jgi:hypothetical protein